SFDFRADVIARWVARNITYRKDGRDTWLFPDETLHARAGDCEDRAILLATLLVAAGISPYNVRVALGKLIVHRYGRKPEVFDHAWPVYRREDGAWDLLEPESVGRGRHRPRRAGSPALAEKIEYQPEYVFNGQHLWRIRGDRAQERSPRAFAEVA